MTDPFFMIFLDQARHSLDVRSLTCCLQKTMDHIGLSRWAHAFNGQITHNYPESWVEHYIREDFAKVDPIITKGGTLSQPFRWSKIANWDILTRQEREYYAEAIDFGLIDGLGVPLVGRGSGVFSMASDQKKREIDHRLAVDRLQLVALAYAFHAIHAQITNEKPLISNPLSPREGECLLWAARGKTSWEIGQIMHVTERTVIFHIENCKKKLSASNRSEATVKAIAAGYIQP